VLAVRRGDADCSETSAHLPAGVSKRANQHGLGASPVVAARRHLLLQRTVVSRARTCTPIRTALADLQKIVLGGEGGLAQGAVPPRGAGVEPQSPRWRVWGAKPPPPEAGVLMHSV